jgi:hypothetical protein
MAAIAIVVPAEVYRRAPADSETLLAARHWEGVSLRDFHLYENGVEQDIDRFITEAAPYATTLKNH